MTLYGPIFSAATTELGGTKPIVMMSMKIGYGKQPRPKAFTMDIGCGRGDDNARTGLGRKRSTGVRTLWLMRMLRKLRPKRERTERRSFDYDSSSSSSSSDSEDSKA